MESFTLIMVNWKGLVLRGIVAIIIGLILALLPGPTLLAVTYLIGIFVLLLGLVAMAMFIAMKEKGKGFYLLLEGVLGIFFGLVTIIYPGITALILILILGVWCLFQGAVELYAGITMKRSAGVRAVVTVTGVLSIAIGLIFVLAPGDGALALIWLIGVFAVAYGILSIIYGMLARSYFKSQGMA